MGEVSDSDVKSLVAGFLDRKTDAEKLKQNKIAVNPEYKTLKPRNELLGKPNNEIQLERLQKERGIKNLSEVIKPESLTQDPAINDRTNTGALWELRTNAGYEVHRWYIQSGAHADGLHNNEKGRDTWSIVIDSIFWTSDQDLINRVTQKIDNGEMIVLLPDSYSP